MMLCTQQWTFSDLLTVLMKLAALNCTFFIAVQGSSLDDHADVDGAND